MGLKAFDKAVFGHIGFAVANTVRSIWFSLTNGAFSSAPFTDETARYYKLLQGYSANLALLTDVSMGVLGGDLKRRERLSARLRSPPSTPIETSVSSAPMYSELITLL